MTEYELVDALSGLVGNSMAAQALFFTALSAYLFVAYAIGKKLSTFQVTFISVGFLLVTFMGGFTQSIILLETAGYSAQLNQVRGSSMALDSGVEPVIFLVILSWLLMTAGALIFMWRIRHAETE